MRAILPPITVAATRQAAPTPHTHAGQGVIFHSGDIAKQFIERAKTTTGLRVTVSLLDKIYATGRTYAEGFKNTMKILFDDHLPKWNYRALPQIE